MYPSNIYSDEWVEIGGPDSGRGKPSVQNWFPNVVPMDRFLFLITHLTHRDLNVEQLEMTWADNCDLLSIKNWEISGKQYSHSFFQQMYCHYLFTVKHQNKQIEINDTTNAVCFPNCWCRMIITLQSLTDCLINPTWASLFQRQALEWTVAPALP